ncbi:hypothetical protein BHE74_00005553 [Ensete ventricosum]|nr:hypothetical protein BHE74_00005553 [Ensete ventricosum]
MKANRARRTKVELPFLLLCCSLSFMVGFFGSGLFLQVRHRLIRPLPLLPSLCLRVGPGVLANYTVDYLLDTCPDVYGPQKSHRTSLHGSCPVIKGQKWVATKWIRDQIQD